MSSIETFYLLAATVAWVPCTLLIARRLYRTAPLGRWQAPDTAFSVAMGVVLAFGWPATLLLGAVGPGVHRALSWAVRR